MAQFSLAVSPPRFELTTQAGTRVREVIQLSADDPRASIYSVKTADWRLEPDGSVTFFDELVPGSCRPWVAIERRDVTVSVGRPYRFRFEVLPPAGTAPVECRFAIMLEGRTEAAAGAPPISARVGVIVYLAVGDVAPKLVVVDSGVERIKDQLVPFLRVRNDGSAHGRMDGFLTGTDAGGKSFDLTPSSSPIMPGEVRSIALTRATENGQTAESAPTYPLLVRGKLEWGKGRSTGIEQRFSP